MLPAILPTMCPHTVYESKTGVKMRYKGERKLELKAFAKACARKCKLVFYGNNGLIDHFALRITMS